MVLSPRPAFSEPLHATFVDGEVVILGPGPIHGAFSIEAARLSARLLAEAADQAARQAAPESDDEAL